jgi:2-oxoglutarate ferredoxin oxidoreductase subunit delta
MMKQQREPSDLEQKSVPPAKVLINKDRCKGCSYCTEYCPGKALKMSQEISAKGYLLAAVDDPAKCSNCGLCEIICPEFAIRLIDKKQNQN